MVLVMLQRDPPLTRILAPGLRAVSIRATDREGFCLRVKIAVARPAAPAPTIATSYAGEASVRGGSLSCLHLRPFAAVITSEDDGPPIVGQADDLGPVAAALAARGRRLMNRGERGVIVNHIVI